MHRREEYEEEMSRKKGGEGSMDSKKGIASFAGGMIFISLALIIGPFFLKVGWTIQMVLMGFGVLGLIIGGILVTIAKLYVKTSANIAFYRTGQGKPKVIIDGGAIVVPVIHSLIEVLLETMKLEVVKNGPEALICKDCLRADISVGFYIRVKKDEIGVKAAATSFGRDATNPNAIKDRLMEKLVSALRSVAMIMDLNELNQNREKFAKAVQDAVSKDIEINGLILETVTIFRLDMTDPKNLKEDNVFDAEGLKKASAITQAQKIQRNEIERNAELAITKRNVDTRKNVLAQLQDQAFAEADQKAKVANQQAEKEKDVAQFKIEQDQQVATKEVEKEQAIQAAGFKKEAALAVESQKTETAKITKDQAVEVANRQREVAVADAEAKRATAQATQRLAEATEQEAAQKVITAAEVEVAERNKKKAVIMADQEGEQQLIKQKKSADAAAYTKTREAEADKVAAENQAQAQIRLAEAALVAKQREAEGDRAVKIVPVQVASEQVEVDRKSVEVLTQKLKAQDTYQQAAIQLEIVKAQIAAGQVVGVEMAKAIGLFMSKGEFNVFGSPETLSDMTAKFASGLGITQILQGINNGSPLLGGLIGKALETAGAGLDAAKTKAEEVTGEVTGKEKKGKGEKSTPPVA
ncbi:MAG: hypothetical protein A2Y67_02690 [Candidatus Buchananbacteria bacterium RBG_13_39_9]|uniref:Band 7 domain-containing protein n=1 Tax=Candidatus Buchananbacteria bacterium RBG_13_39_9 TaxID=1797531 RepID=A0A1G1XN56_9BACT|nr:MAG: hypothetical protein A2Y67_02690 [Candidatus Buchananbacteria bacterium RBG_13_39_9]